MTTPATILRESALALPVLAAVGAVLGGAWGAVDVLAGGVLALLNFGALTWATCTLLGDRPERRVTAVGVLIVKTTLFLGGFALLMTSLDPVRVALGGCVVLVGIAVRGVADAARPAHDPWAEEA